MVRTDGCRLLGSCPLPIPGPFGTAHFLYTHYHVHLSGLGLRMCFWIDEPFERCVGERYARYTKLHPRLLTPAPRFKATIKKTQS